MKSKLSVTYNALHMAEQRFPRNRFQSYPPNNSRNRTQVFLKMRGRDPLILSIHNILRSFNECGCVIPSSSRLFGNHIRQLYLKMTFKTAHRFILKHMRAYSSSPPPRALMASTMASARVTSGLSSPAGSFSASATRTILTMPSTT